MSEIPKSQINELHEIVLDFLKSNNETFLLTCEASFELKKRGASLLNRMTEDDLKNFDESFKDLVSHNYFAPFGRNTNTDRSWKCRACIVVLTLLYHYLKSTITGGIDSVLEAFAQAISDYLNSSYEVIWELLRGHRTPLPNRYATHLFSEICRRFGFCKAN